MKFNGSNWEDVGSPGSLPGIARGASLVIDSSDTLYQAYYTVLKLTATPLPNTEVNMSKNGNPTPFNLTLTGQDADGDTLSWSISSPAGNGTAVVGGTGITKSIVYTPTPNYIGTDSFIVQVSDGTASYTTTVNVNIAATSGTPEVYLPLIIREE